MAPSEDNGGPSGLEAWEQRLWGEGHSVVAGTDEAGRGPLAGPVVAAAFVLLKHDDPEVREVMATIFDSKQMAPPQREDAYKTLTDPRFSGRIAYAISVVDVSEIDKANILMASLSAMSRCVAELPEPRPDVVLVDGCNRPPGLLAPGEKWTRGKKHDAEDPKQSKLGKFFSLRPAPKPVNEEASSEPTPWKPKRVEAVIAGDARVPSISAASVLAKVHRDHLMQQLHEKYPVYGFDSHKGYGTEAHMKAIKEHGICPEHRRSFGPIKEVLGIEATPNKRQQIPGVSPAAKQQRIS